MKEVNKSFDKRIVDFSILSKERGKIMGAAAIMIVLFHFAQMSNCFSGILQNALYTFCGGVEIFVLMSGIGLYYSFQKNNSIKQFYIKRIYNVYFIFLVITLPYIIWWSLVNKEVDLLFVNWLLPNYLSGYARDVWYIPFAMVMYLLYPVIYKFLFNDKIYKYRFLLVSAFSVLWYVVCFMLYKSENSYFQIAEIALFRFPIFLVGCLIGELVYNKRKCKTVMIIAAVLSLVLMFLAHEFIIGQLGFRFTNAFASIVYLVILALFFSYVKIDFINKCLEIFGSMSLELYLTHMLIFKVIAYYKNNEGIYYIIGAIIAVIISYPLSKLRGKFVELSKKRLSPKTNS